MARATLQFRLKPNDVVNGKYVVVKKLGAGGVGSVYRCTTKRPVKGFSGDVALKVLETVSELSRFQREKRLLGSIRHPHVVQLLDYGTCDRHPYLVLEFMEGGSLRDLMDKMGRFSLEDAAWVLIQAVRGLRASRTIHRDLKPENLLVGRGIGKNGSLKLIIDDIRKGAVIKIADFGLAKSHVSNTINLTQTGQVMGTPVYMSPEQCRNMRTVTVSSDIYALGIIFFELLTGKPPFDADNAYDVMAMHCNQEPAYPSRLDPQAKHVLMRCLAKNPGERYRKLYSLERDLAIIAGLGEPEPDRVPWARIVIIGGLIVLFLLLIVLGNDIIAGFQQLFLAVRR